MAFNISTNLGNQKPFFQFSNAAAGAAHIEVIIDNKRIDREHASASSGPDGRPPPGMQLAARPTTQVIKPINRLSASNVPITD